MPPKTAKLKKKSQNNKTKKKKPDRKQFKVNGKTFKLKDNSTQVRIERTESGNVIKFKNLHHIFFTILIILFIFNFQITYSKISPFLNLMESFDLNFVMFIQ